MTIQEGLREFYQINHFEEDGGEKDAWAWIKLGFFSLPIPNPESRKQVLFLHDIHHLITENGTDWRGESSVGAWEIATGGWGTRFYIWWIILGSLLIGVFRFPKDTFKWFVRGLRTKSLIGQNMNKSKLLKMSVMELQEKLGLSEVSDAAASTTEILKYIYWALLALIINLLPLVLLGYFLL